jgi:hypothetical protein
MRMLHCPGLVAVPLEDREASLRPIRDHGEIVHAAPVREETPLALLDADREVAPDAGAVLPMVPIVWDVRDLGPRADRLRLLPLELPGGLGEPADLGLELLREIGADGVLDPAVRVLAPAVS